MKSYPVLQGQKEAELEGVQVWDVGGSKKSEQLQRLAEEPGRLVANSRFLGRVEVPLSETLSLKRGQPSVHAH